MKKFDPTLYFITDSTNYTEKEFLFRVEQALKGGATLLQLREKEKSTREYIELAEKVHEIAKRYNVPLIIDDRVDVSLAIDAEGVHVGASDMPIHTILQGSFLILFKGISRHCQNRQIQHILPGQAANGLGSLVAIHNGHLNIHQH